MTGLNDGWLVGALGSVIGGGGLWRWLTTRAQLRQARQAVLAAQPADLATAYAGFARTLNDQANAFIGALQAERAGLVGELSELREKIDHLTAEHEQCLGDNRNLQSRIDGLERLMRLEANSKVTFEGGDVTVADPASRPPK